MLSCDYNGWNDAPEDEREWFDQHPEIWTGPKQELASRPHRLARRPPSHPHRGGLAA